MESLSHLLEEAKVRFLWWAVCIVFLSYLFSLASKSLWFNIPISVFLLGSIRVILNRVDFQWKPKSRAQRHTYLAHLQRQQLHVDNPLLTTPLDSAMWRRKVDSPLIESALDKFIRRVLHEFMVDLWYSSITPDKEAPELVRLILRDIFGEVSVRIGDINLVELLTRDMVDLIGNHLDLYRRNQSIIGEKVMSTLSLDERDERLRKHLIASKEIHPALLSPESEYKVLQKLVSGLLALVLRPRESQCPLIRCLSRELLTCLVLQPLMNLASPAYINVLIEGTLVPSKDNVREVDKDKTHGDQNDQYASRKEQSDLGKGLASSPQGNQLDLGFSHPMKKLVVEGTDNAEQNSGSINTNSVGDGERSPNTINKANLLISQDEPIQSLQQKPADWARVLEAARERRSQVLAPENLENLWTKGRHYKNKTETLGKVGPFSGATEVVHPSRTSGVANVIEQQQASMPGRRTQSLKSEKSLGADKKILSQVQASNFDAHGRGKESAAVCSYFLGELNSVLENNSNNWPVEYGKEKTEDEFGIKVQLKHSGSNSSLSKIVTGMNDVIERKDLNHQDLIRPEMVLNLKNASESPVPNERSEHLPHVSLITCRVLGAYFEKIGSKSFAVYSIAVTLGGTETWCVRRRYSNFERLHRNLKDIPNYLLHLPPKRFLSSSIDDQFVHQRCILLDKYLQDLLSIRNLAEQHEVLDFLSASSKNYSFGKSPSVMKTLAVNVDDAMDDIVRQFKGVSDGLRRKVTAPDDYPLSKRDLGYSLNGEERLGSSFTERSQSGSDDDEGLRGLSHEETQVNGWHSDNELNSKRFPPRIVKHLEGCGSIGTDRSQHSEASSNPADDCIGVPSEWTPPNVSVPVLNLVDKIFRLKKRGWIRRQVLWISKQVLQLVMEDAIDDWLLRQVHWLRREDVIVEGIKWLEDSLWPEGTFFTKLSDNPNNMEGVLNQKSSTTPLYGGSSSMTFEMQRDAVWRAANVKKLLLEGAPATVVNLIGHKQYKRCMKDIYFFLQSTTCVKQLAYSVLELLLLSIFPELHELIQDIHRKAHS